MKQFTNDSRTGTRATAVGSGRSALAAPGATAVTQKTRDGMSPEQEAAALKVSGIGTGAVIAAGWGKATFEDLTFPDTLDSLLEFSKQIRANDFKQAESMLTSQAVALNALFGELTRRAGLNIGQHMDAAERYLRLALKAQTQCRATLETLATIKNPPVVFAKQANVNNGGQQQINNGTAAADAGRSGESKPTAVTHARGEILDFGQSKVLTRMSASASELLDIDDPLATSAVSGRATQRRGN